MYSLPQFSTYEILSRIYFCKFSIKYIGIIVTAIYLFL